MRIALQSLYGVGPKVAEIFTYIDSCKEKAKNGWGKVEDSVDAKDYLNGIKLDAKKILSQGRESKGKI